MKSTCVKLTNLLTFVLFGVIACAPANKTPKESNSLPVIQAVNYPLAYFAERIVQSFGGVVRDGWVRLGLAGMSAPAVCA